MGRCTSAPYSRGSEPTLRIVYLEPEQFLDPPPPFRTGEAGHVRLGEGGTIETDSRVALSANSTHALLGHGVVADLNRLPIEGTLGSGRDALFPTPPSKMRSASSMTRIAAPTAAVGSSWWHGSRRPRRSSTGCASTTASTRERSPG